MKITYDTETRLLQGDNGAVCFIDDEATLRGAAEAAAKCGKPEYVESTAGPVRIDEDGTVPGPNGERIEVRRGGGGYYAPGGPVYYTPANNAAQDLGDVGGVVGTVGVAIGQFAEYETKGGFEADEPGAGALLTALHNALVDLANETQAPWEAHVVVDEDGSTMSMTQRSK